MLLNVLVNGGIIRLMLGVRVKLIRCFRGLLGISLIDRHWRK